LSFIEVAESQGIRIYARKGDRLSFFNSPYYSHRHYSALDIYSGDREFGGYAYSPVDGRVVLIRPFNPPTPKQFRGSEKDWIILIECGSNSSLSVRLLHVEPAISEGEKIHVGDSIGRLLRTGHFDFWTDPHIHVEVRDPKNVIRAKGAYPLNPLNASNELEFKNRSSQLFCPEFEVSSVERDYVLVKAEDKICRLGNFWGLRCEVDGQTGILDAGIPHYGYGGVHLKDSSCIKTGSSVSFEGIKLGVIKKVFRNYAVFAPSPIRISLGNLQMRGLSLYLSLGKIGEVKVIPFKPSDLRRINLQENAKIRIYS